VSDEREEEKARQFVDRHFPEVAAFLAAERTAELPAYGPSEVFDDEGITPHVVVRVAVALSREQLVTALTIGVTNLGIGADPAEMTAEEVRREVEAYFAACGLVEIDTLIRDGWPRSFPEAARVRREDIEAAVERAYPGVSR
jgi:hypothetical protein